jgi:hypothetical protein
MTSIQCKNEWNETIQVNPIQGDRTRGIGYVGNSPVIIDAGEIVPAPHPGDKWAWGDGTGRYWATHRRADGGTSWHETGPITPDGGWKLY